MTKEDIIRKLTSRKFWAAIVGFVTGLLVYLGKSAGEAEQIGALIMMGASVVAYIFGEGWADASHAHPEDYDFNPYEDDLFEDPQQTEYVPPNEEE